jgi:tetratricopeptide (TPR) repeat protein
VPLAQHLLYRGMVLRDEGDREGAKEAYERAFRHTDSPAILAEAHYGLARLKLGPRDLPAAIDHLDRAHASTTIESR